MAAPEKRRQDGGATRCGKYCDVVQGIPLPVVFGDWKALWLKRLQMRPGELSFRFCNQRTISRVGARP